jgi:hypothetical protein
MSSGIGRGLVLASGAYAAIGAFTGGMSALQANQAAAAQAQGAVNSSIAATQTSAAAGLQQFADDGIANLPSLAGGADVAGTNGAAVAMSTPDTLVASGTNAASVQVSAQQLAGDQGAVASASGHETLGMGNETGSVNSGSPPSSQASAAQGAVTPLKNASDVHIDNSLTDPYLAAANTGGYTGVNTVDQGAMRDSVLYGGPVGGRGFWNGALYGQSPASAAITAGGSLLGGVGQGIAQKQATEDAIRASQWAPNRWTTPSLSNQAIAASQGNINVPQGYLARAQAIRQLTANAGVPWQGPAQPGPVPGAAGAVPGVPGPVPLAALPKT